VKASSVLNLFIVVKTKRVILRFRYSCQWLWTGRKDREATSPYTSRHLAPSPLQLGFMASLLSESSLLGSLPWPRNLGLTIPLLSPRAPIYSFKDKVVKENEWKDVRFAPSFIYFFFFFSFSFTQSINHLFSSSSWTPASFSDPFCHLLGGKAAN